MIEHSETAPKMFEIKPSTIPGRGHLHDLCFAHGQVTNVESLTINELRLLGYKIQRYVESQGIDSD